MDAMPASRKEDVHWIVSQMEKITQRKPKLCRFLDFLCGAEQAPQVSFCNNRCRFQLYVWSHATHTILKIGRMLPKLF
jgi:hypothetical protein